MLLPLSSAPPHTALVSGAWIGSEAPILRHRPPLMMAAAEPRRRRLLTDLRSLLRAPRGAHAPVGGGYASWRAEEQMGDAEDTSGCGGDAAGGTAGKARAGALEHSVPSQSRERVPGLRPAGGEAAMSALGQHSGKVIGASLQRPSPVIIEAPVFPTQAGAASLLQPEVGTSCAATLAGESSCEDLALLEETISGLLEKQDALRDAASVCEVQDLLFRRFKAKYVGGKLPADYLDDQVTPERVALLNAFRKGNVAAIRRSIASGMSWDFVYPPAPTASDGTRQVELEGFCRSPLALLVRPDEGNLLRVLPGVAKSEQLALIEEALTSGCADPNYPQWYWSSPGAHACFEGDVQALQVLNRFGCNLEQKLEWLLQSEPKFTFVHAAAFNGNSNVLEYLRPRVRPETFLALDADGSNALHTLMESSRELRTAELLLELGVDGYSKNQRDHSPLSMAIEALPDLAFRLLNAKSRFEYRWWGNDLYWYSFDGIVLPTSEQGRAFTLRDLAGRPTTIEQLILRYERRELLKTPVMRAIIECKWERFASSIYQYRVAQYSAMVGGLLGAIVVPTDDPLFWACTVVCGGGWAGFVVQWAREVHELGLEAYLRSTRVVADWRVRNLINALDALHLLLVPLVPIFKAATTVGAMSPEAPSTLAPVASLLQITLALRALQYVALYRSIGPLLVTIVEMFSDVLSWVGFYIFILFGFANGFFVLFSTASAAASAGAITEGAITTLNGAPGDVSHLSYATIVEEELLWLLGNIDFDFFESLAAVPALYTSALAFFWAYTSLSVFVMLNLLIAIFNSTYERVEVESEAEWLWLRLEAMLDFEAAAGTDVIEEYYDELRMRNQQRAIRRLDPDEQEKRRVES